LRNEEIKQRLYRVLLRLHLPYACDPNPEETLAYMKKDKKADHGHWSMVQVDEIGKAHLEDWNEDMVKEKLDL
jgi:3-dehydroquinate synthase